MATRKTNPDFFNGVPELVVLELLSRRPMYGYELVQAIKEESSGALEFGEGCIYPLLHKLEARGDLSSRRLDVGGRSRVVYRVTSEGYETTGRINGPMVGRSQKPSAASCKEASMNTSTPEALEAWSPI